MLTDTSVKDLQITDLNSVNDAVEAASCIIRRANSTGIFLPERSRQSRETAKLIREATCWINTVRERIDTYTHGDALRLTDAYDLIHRIAYGVPADRIFINGIILRAFRAMTQGDGSVDQYLMFRLIHRAAGRREKEFIGTPLTWTFKALDSWHREATEGFDRERLTDYDIISRLTLLLESDLYAYEGRCQQQFKRRLLVSHRCYLDGYAAPDPRTEAAHRSLRHLSSTYL